MSELLGMDYKRKVLIDYVGKHIIKISRHERGYMIITFNDGTGLTVDPDNLFDENGMRLETEEIY